MECGEEPQKDYYKVLEVDYDATDDSIRLSYLRLALKWHPDKHKGNSAVTAKFQEINEAYKGIPDKIQGNDTYMQWPRYQPVVNMGAGADGTGVNGSIAQELTGRIIRVEFAKSFRKPAPPPPPGASLVEERHKIYVSNLAWKARSVHLKEFFSAKYKPLSARVVFENATGRSAGYGFVAFATKEEAAAAIAELDGKELLDRPVRLRFRQKDDDKTESAPEEEKSAEEQHDES
ncbi:uncharacterized protein LOC109707706 isoform X2 [Ananas comosus]|uniref:Uncharacterized protein LOC109707706 isoform X2 n=1 Tax=Ananas comosus TaxID=4615 RepID=A0A6P5EUD4_ANACO|nr:uncharacterized protein LOC109707706 isoform X2 [Ananas comosus]